MGLDISKIADDGLKRLLTEYDTNPQDGKIDDKEFSIFKTKASERDDISVKLYNQAIDLYERSTRDAQVPAESNSAVTHPNKKLTKTDKKLNNSREKLLVKEIKNSTLDNLEDNLKNYTSREELKLVNEIKAVKDFVVSQNFNSKDDVEALKKKISKNVQFSDFQKDLADEFVELAKKKQIATETAKLVGLFDSIKKEYADNNRTLNYTAMLKDLDAKMKADGLKGKSYYSKEAYEGLIASIKEEFEKNALKQYDEMSPGEKKVSESDVKNRFKRHFEKDDKFARKTIDELDLIAGVTKRRLNIERAQKKLETISKKDLISKLGTDLFVKLESYLESHKTGDAYNLTGLSEAIRAAIGADEEMNSYEDKRQGEANVALENLKLATKSPTLDEKDLKKLKKLCAIEDAPKSRDVKEAFLGEAGEAVTRGAVIGAVLGMINIEQIVDQSNSLVDVFVEQKVKINMGTAIPAAITAEFILEGLTNLLFGKEKGERTCFDYTKAEGKTFQDFVEEVKLTETNETRKKAIIALAKLYYDKFQEKWNENFINDMKEMAGNNVLNCKELRIATLRGNNKVVNNGNGNGNGGGNNNDPLHFYCTKDQDPVDATYEEVPAIDGSKTSWAAIARQYECLVEKYTLMGAIRILKIAQAITNGDYSERNLDKLYKLSLKGASEMKNIEGLDYDTYKNILTANVLSKLEYENGQPKAGTGVKVPANLAGCDRNALLSLKVGNLRDDKAKVTKSNGHKADRRKTSDGQAGVYSVTFDGGQEQQYSTRAERDKAVSDFRAKHKKVEQRQDCY